MGVKRYLDEWTERKIKESGAVSFDGPLRREHINAYTLEKLRETLRLATERSPFYREKYGSAAAKGIASLEEFGGLPFSTPEELRIRETDLLCVKTSEISRIVTLDTGGSTGAPKRVYFTEDDQRLTVDFFENGMKLMADSGDNVLILMPTRVPGSVGRLLSKALNNFGAFTVDYGLPNMSPSFPKERNRRCAEELLRIMEDEWITVAVALPTHMRMLAEVQAERGHRIGLKNVLLSAEYVDDRTVRFISSVFGCGVFEHYGMTEMGLGCAVSCGYGSGYHVRETDIYIEIIDPETGKTVKDGDVGEIVFSTLTRKGMPFIRYRTGDYSRWLTEPCPCGSVLRRLAKVGPRDAVKGYLL